MAWKHFLDRKRSELLQGTKERPRAGDSAAWQSAAWQSAAWHSAAWQSAAQPQEHEDEPVAAQTSASTD